MCLDVRNEWPLDRMCLQCDVTKKNREDLSVPPREGAYVHGLYMEGARWDVQVNYFGQDLYIVWIFVERDYFLIWHSR